MFRHFTYLALSGCLLFLSACDSSSSKTTAPDSITGDWTGVVVSKKSDGSTESFDVTLALVDNQSMVSGNGTLDGRAGPQTFTVVESESNYLHPLIDLVLLFTTPPPGKLSGNVSTNREEIHGTMQGPGFSGTADFQMVLTRKAP